MVKRERKRGDAAKLRTIRESRDLSQAQLARLLWPANASGNTCISALETGQRVFGLELASRIARVLGVAVEEVLQ